MADYEFRPGGSLKLKGSVADGGVTKKKKKHSSSKAKDKDRGDIEERRLADEVVRARTTDAARISSPMGSGRNSPAAASGSNSTDKKTDAERRFEEIQRERLAKRVAKLATKTHKERVNEFNQKLESLSEHHDIPKVGPG